MTTQGDIRPSAAAVEERAVAPEMRSVANRYAVAIAITALATLSRLALNPVLHHRAAGYLYLLGVFLAGLYGGLGPGALCAAVSGVLVWYLFVPIQHSFVLKDPAEVAALGLFAGVGLVTALLSERLRSETRRAEAGEQEARMQADEAERRRDAAARAERRTAAILGSIADGFVAIDREWRYTYVNPRAERLLGMCREEMAGRPPWEVFREPSGVDGQRGLRDAMEDGRPREFEMLHGQTSRWLDVHVYPSDEGLSVYFTDTTERRAADLALRASERRFATTLSSIGDAVIATDASGRVTFMNAVAEELTGWPMPGTAGRPLDEVFAIVNEETRGSVESPVARVIREQRVVGLANHTLLIARDGTERAIDDSGAPIHDDDGALTGVVLVFRDITDSRAAERERAAQTELVRRNEERLRRLVESNIVGVLFARSDGRITDANEAFLQTVGQTGVDLEAGPVRWTDMTPPEWREADEAAAAELRSVGRCLPYEKEYLRPDGARVPVLVALADLDAEDGLAVGYVVDITDRKRAEQERTRQLAEISQLNARLQRAMSETHHRIKNNLQVISALIGLQAAASGDTVPAAALSRLTQHIGSLATLHDILTRQARDDAENDTLSVRDAMRKLLPILQAIVVERSVHLACDDARLPVRQGTAVAILVNELVANAVKHGGGDIDVSFAVVDGRGELTVRDGGPGFPETFDPASAGHVGIELIESLSRWDLRGSTRYENAPEGGARVVVEFPLGGP